MDSSHVSLVSLLLRADGFENLRCDKNMNLGINMTSMAKILKCASNDDIISLETKGEDADALTLKFESPSESCSLAVRRTGLAAERRGGGEAGRRARAGAHRLPGGETVDTLRARVQCARAHGLAAARSHSTCRG